jgi:hypothetical protein
MKNKYTLHSLHGEIERTEAAYNVSKDLETIELDTRYYHYIGGRLDSRELSTYTFEYFDDINDQEQNKLTDGNGQAFEIWQSVEDSDLYIVVESQYKEYERKRITYVEQDLYTI